MGAPVPMASLVLINTAYNSVFGTTGTPEGFAYIFAIDWFMDRMRTTCNVTGDCVVTGITAYRCPIDESLEAFAEKKEESSVEVSERRRKSRLDDEFRKIKPYVLHISTRTRK